jgi:translocation and assembly module TamB
MRRTLKISAWIVGPILFTAVVLVGALLIAGNTDSGRALIERVTYRLTAGSVRLSGLGGSFPSRLTLRELQLVDGQGVWLTAEQLAVHWSPLQLLTRRIRVEDLQVARLHMERTPISDHPGSGGTVSIPHIEVAQLSIDVLELGAPLVGTPATLSLRGGVRLRSLQNANADLMARRLDSGGEYTAHVHFDPVRMDASLVVHEPASGPLENLLQLPGLGALSATATLKGLRSAERFDLLLDAGGAHAHATGNIDFTRGFADLEYALQTPALSPRADVAWQRLELRGGWHGPWPTARADGRLQIDGLRIAGDTQIQALNADIATNAGTLTFRALLDGLQIPGPQPRLFVDDPLKISGSLRLNEASRPLELTATHRLFSLNAQAVTAGRQRASLDLRLPDLAPFAALGAQDVRGDASIKAQLSGDLASTTLAVDANVGLSGGTASWIAILGPRVALQLAGGLSADSIKLERLRLVGRALTLSASGNAARAVAKAPEGRPGPGNRASAAQRGSAAGGMLQFIQDLQTRWEIGISDLGVISPDLAGTLQASGSLTGPPTSLRGDAVLTSTLSVRGSASGTVAATVHARGLPSSPSGTLQAHGMVDGAPLTVDLAVERSGGNAFRASIHQAQWKSAQAEGNVSGADWSQVSGRLEMQVGQLSDFDHLLGTSIQGKLEGNASFLPRGGHSQVELNLNGADLVLGQIAGALQLRAAGTTDSLSLNLDAQLPNLHGAPAKISSAATLNLAHRELRLASAAADYRGQTLHLLAPSKLSFGNGLSVDELKMGVQEAQFELNGQLSPTLDLRASLRQVKPGLVNVFVPGLLAGGTVDAQTRLRGTLAAPTGQISVDATGILFADEAATGLPPAEAHAQADLAGDTAALEVRFTAGTGSLFTVSGNAPLNADGALDLKIAGKVDIGLVNPLLEARGLHAAGQLAVDATLTGSATAPQVGGSITLAQGSLRDYARGLNLSDITAEIVGSEGTLQVKSFKAAAASGTLAMTGTIGVLQPDIPVDLKITAKDAQPIASSILTADLDADVRVSGTARRRLDVAGTVHVNRATIGIPNSLPPDVAVLDVHRRGRAAPAQAEKQLVIGIDLSLKAPRQILVQGRGLDAELGGDVHVSGTTDSLTVNGGFDLQRGTFSLAGNRLNFTEGRVSFDGAGLRKKIDPTLDFTAQTTVGEYTAILRITGVADAPRFEFSSTPAPSLPQEQIMGLLLFGSQNAAQLSALQVAQVGATLAALSGVGGGGLNPLVKLQKTLGLDRLTVGGNPVTTATGATENSGAAIAAGRYVSKRVYVEAKQTTTGSSQVQVDIDLTKHLKLQTRLGNGAAITQGTTPENDPGSSIGLSYLFEY